MLGTGPVLQNNAADDLTVAVGGSFTFASPVASGGTYAVTVKTQPASPSQTCTVSSASGAMVDSNVTNLAVVCAINSFTVGGTVTGLNGTGLVLQNNAGDDLPVSADGSFTFPLSVASGAGFLVTVKTQPTMLSQTCTVSNGTGIMGNATVTNVAVACAATTARFAYVVNSGPTLCRGTPSMPLRAP